MHERERKRAKQAIQHIGIHFNHIGRFEKELTQLAEPTEQEIRQMREKIEEVKKEKSRATRTVKQNTQQQGEIFQLREISFSCMEKDQQ